MIILAIDPGTATGWACSDGRHGVKDLAPLKAAPKKKREAEPEYARCGKLWQLLFSLMESWDATIVCEGAVGYMRGRHAVRVSNELRGVVKAFCHVMGARYVEVQPQDLQRWVTGRCQVPKEEMLRLAAHYEAGVTDDNEADALHLLAWARANLNKPGPKGEEGAAWAAAAVRVRGPAERVPRAGQESQEASVSIMRRNERPVALRPVEPTRQDSYPPRPGVPRAWGQERPKCYRCGGHGCLGPGGPDCLSCGGSGWARQRKRAPCRAAHGTLTRYVAGCRCAECRAASTAYKRERRAKGRAKT